MLYVGIVATEQYYSTFGLRYYSINIPINHIIFRAITFSFRDPWFIVLYLVSICFFFSLDFFPASASRKLRLSITLACYLAALIIVLASNYLGVRAGRRDALRDMVKETTSLRVIWDLDIGGERAKEIKNDIRRCMRPPRDSTDNATECRRPQLLLATSSEIVIFVPIEGPTESRRPSLDIIKLGSSGSYVISPGLQ